MTTTLTNVTQIVEQAETAADVITDVFNTYGQMNDVRTTAIFMLYEALAEIDGLEADAEMVRQEFTKLYNADEEIENLGEITDCIEGAQEYFTNEFGNGTLINILFLMHLALEVQYTMHPIVQNAKEAGVDGAHKEFALFRITANHLVHQFNVLQNRLLAA